MLRCIGVSLTVPERVLCRDLTVTFEPGQAWAVLGRNGAGKSTLIHALAGLIAPAAGVIQLNDKPVRDYAARDRARVLGALLQMEDGSFWGTVEDYVLLGRFPYADAWRGYGRGDHDAALAALTSIGMHECAGRKLTTLSGGERQRVRLAQLLAQAPAVLLLDEPLQHLDLAHQAHVLKLIGERVREQRETAVMVLHQPLWIGRTCTHALILSGDGSAHAGAAEDMLTLDRLEHTYGCRLREVSHGDGRSFVPHV
ncbi:MAG: ABC transporter ATP-binding protein [Pseudomonadota bacterium]